MRSATNAFEGAASCRWISLKSANAASPGQSAGRSSAGRNGSRNGKRRKSDISWIRSDSAWLPALAALAAGSLSGE